MMQIWTRAKSLAAQTPAERNRYVDFLRSLSIIVVIVGHWLIATAYVANGEFEPGHLLKSDPGMQWLTWIFQVMPVFFIVGGYANAVSLESAARKNIPYAAWLFARLNRLIAPLLILVIAWALIALVMSLSGARTSIIQYGSQAALIPTWFLAIYIMVAILAPLTYRFWQKLGFVSFWIFAGIAILIDALFFAADVRWPGWSNYFWIWLAVHQLGYAWRSGRTGSPGVLLIYSVAGFATLTAMILVGPYPLAMVGSPDEGLSNTLPPKITLLALGVFQYGLLLSLEGPMRRALNDLRLWAATVLVNSMIMTVYLWHITVMIVFIAALYFAGFGLGIEPASAAWWQTRPLWVAALVMLLIPVALLLSPLERRGQRGSAPIPSAAQQVSGAIMICLGVALLAMWGFGGGPLRYLDIASFVIVIAGSALCGLLPGIGNAKRT
jgi:hypothetical protein